MFGPKPRKSQFTFSTKYYDMDHKNVAGITMQKMINAARRGVKVYLVVDDLNYYVDKEQIKLLQDAGGVCINN